MAIALGNSLAELDAPDAEAAGQLAAGLSDEDRGAARLLSIPERYPSLKETMGSMRLARKLGTRQAITDTPKMTPVTTTRTRGS